MRLDLDTNFDALLSDPYAEHPVVNRHILNGGGGGQQQSYQNTTSESGPPSYLKPYLQQGITDLSNYYGSHPQAPAYYSGEVVAPLSTTTNAAIDNATNWANNNPLLPGSAASLGKFTSGQYLDPTTNPQFKAALAASHQPYIDQFNNSILPGVQSAFEGAGRFGSGANQNTTQQALKTLDTTINNADATAGANYYTTALNQILQANGMVPQLNQATLANNSMLFGAGQTIDQNRQAQDSAAQAAYNYNQNAQMNYISQYLSMLNGGYPGGTTTSSGYGMSYQPTNSGAGILGGVMGGLGLGLQAFSAFSDRRLKENIKDTGIRMNGQAIKSFNYKGSPGRQIGLIAQEVERKTPEAVQIDPASGFKKVNYAKALGLGLMS